MVTERGAHRPKTPSFPPTPSNPSGGAEKGKRPLRRSSQHFYNTGIGGRVDWGGRRWDISWPMHPKPPHCHVSECHRHTVALGPDQWMGRRGAHRWGGRLPSWGGRGTSGNAPQALGGGAICMTFLGQIHPPHCELLPFFRNSAILFHLMGGFQRPEIQANAPKEDASCSALQTMEGKRLDCCRRLKMIHRRRTTGLHNLPQQSLNTSAGRCEER